MGDAFLDALLDEMVSSEGRPSSTSGREDKNYLDLLSEMVGQEKSVTPPSHHPDYLRISFFTFHGLDHQDDFGDSAIDELLNSMTTASKGQLQVSLTANTNSNYDDVLEDLLSDVRTRTRLFLLEPPPP